MLIKKLLTGLGLAAVTVSTALLANCVGGGGSSAPALYYPYQTVYGDICLTTEPTPGCTFLSNGARISVTEDRHYGRYGGGSNDMEYVYFDYCSTRPGICGYVYGPGASRPKLELPISDFAGFVGGSFIGVGTTGLFWEDVLFGTYWIGRQGVLYSANQGKSNYGRAINNQEASMASDTNLAAAASDVVADQIDKATKKLMADYGFKPEKAHVVAEALYNWAAGAHERGYTTVSEMDKTFTAAFGMKFSEALAAANALRFKGDATLMQKYSAPAADALGLRADQYKKFIKAMYRDGLASVGYNVDAYDW